MPSKPKRPCIKPGCPNLTSERYCKDHAHLAEQQQRDRHKQYDTYQRDKQTAAFYRSVAWKRVREQRLMMDHGLCQECLRKQRIAQATEVDHVIPIRVRWDLRLTISNLRSLCHRCHMIKTAEDRRVYGTQE
jgi:HNH endonuclease.